VSVIAEYATSTQDDVLQKSFHSTEMKPPLRIAILEADTPPDDIVARYGRYGKVFRTLLENAADSLGRPDFSKDDLVLSAYDVVSEQKYPETDDVDAVLISGSSKLTLRMWRSMTDAAKSTTRSTMIHGY
jgi:hypothetical protein